MLHSICQQIWKTQQWPRDWKRPVFIPIPKKGNAKECSNYSTIALISHANKGMLKILQARLQQYVNHELPDVQAGFRKGRGTRDQIANIRWIMEKAKEFQKNIYFCFIDYAMILVFWMLSFKPTFSLSSFTFIKRLFSPSLSAIRVVLRVVHIWSYWYFSRQTWFQLVLLPAQRFSWCTLHIS